MTDPEGTMNDRSVRRQSVKWLRQIYEAITSPPPRSATPIQSHDFVNGNGIGNILGGGDDVTDAVSVPDGATLMQVVVHDGALRYAIDATPTPLGTAGQAGGIVAGPGVGPMTAVEGAVVNLTTNVVTIATINFYR